MSDQHVHALYDSILRTVTIERQIGAGSWKDLPKNDSIQSQRRFLIACGIRTFQQLGGISAISILRQYSLRILYSYVELNVWISPSTIICSSFIPLVLIDRVSRRPLLLSMISVMATVMVVQAALIYQVQNNTNIAHSCGVAAAVMLFIRL
jgi:Sugar (and other) transporter